MVPFKTTEPTGASFETIQDTIRQTMFIGKTNLLAYVRLFVYEREIIRIDLLTYFSHKFNKINKTRESTRNIFNIFDRTGNYMYGRGSYEIRCCSNMKLVI